MAKMPGLKISQAPRTVKAGSGKNSADRRRLAKLQRYAAQLKPRFQFDRTRFFLALLTTIALSSLFTLHLLPDKVRLHIGDISDQDVRAFRPVRYLDEDATEAMRSAAASRVDPVYAPVRYASSEADESATEAFEAIRHERAMPHPSAQRLATYLRQHIGIALRNSNILLPLLTDSANTYHIDQADHALQDALRPVMDNEIRSDRPEDLTRARHEFASRVSNALLPHAYLPAILAIGDALVRPNRELDRERTAANQETERRLVSPQFGQIYAGDIVIRTGETATESTIDKLRALGLQNPRLNAGTVASVTFLTAFMVGVVALYLMRFQKSVYGSNKLLCLLCLLVVLSVLGLKLGDALLGVRLSPLQFGFVSMACVAAAGMLIASLINARVAMLIVALLAAQAGLIIGSHIGFTVIMLLGGVVAIFAVSNIRSRNDLLLATSVLCITNALLCLPVSQIEGDLWSELPARQYLLWAIVSGVISVGAFSLLAALFEKLFGVTTHLGLLELSDPNRPLLQRFCQAAPGTYTHSVMVGNLAVSAAEAVGADALLCRVGAYYHDLGKMRRAEFFVENQAGGDNVHSRLNPSLSALVLTAHVKEGLEIAEAEKLPPIIKDFITEHHGTSLIKYFYYQHTSGETSDLAPGLEQHFRYAGPKPQSRETAILMLADGVEAASRTLEKPTIGRIEDLVDKIISVQLTDGQLDECDLTLRDLRGIRDAFVRLLGGMLHSRVEYPEFLKNASLKTNKNELIDRPTDDNSPVSTVPIESGQTAQPSSATGGSRS